MLQSHIGRKTKKIQMEIFLSEFFVMTLSIVYSQKWNYDSLAYKLSNMVIIVQCAYETSYMAALNNVALSVQ